MASSDTPDFTLFLPPSEAVASALQTLPASELSAFVDAHLVQNERVLLKNAEQTFGPVTATNKWVAVGSVNATVLGQDVLTSGGLIQVRAVRARLYPWSRSLDGGADFVDFIWRTGD